MFNLNSMAPWVPIFTQAVENELSARNNDPPFVTFQLATINDGFPRSRTLVYRGWLFGNKSSNIVTFVTDRRSEKYRELEANDHFEAVFYFEKLKKQFRFRGCARIIDQVYHPVIDMSFVDTVRRGRSYESDEEDIDKDQNDEPTNPPAANGISESHPAPPQEAPLSGSLPESTPASCNISAISGSDSESDDSEESSLSFSAPHSPVNAPKKTAQHVPINSSLCSPSLTQLTCIGDLSFTHLAQMQYHAPTKEDWSAELRRQWEAISKKMKKQFRKPAPLTNMDDESMKQIDKIRRGVDGKKDDDGYKNFAVVALFVEHVDYVELDRDRRVIFEKDGYNQWGEQEVCP